MTGFLSSPVGFILVVVAIFIIVLFLSAYIGAGVGAIVEETTGVAARKRYYTERKAKGIEGSTEYHG